MSKRTFIGVLIILAAAVVLWIVVKPAGATQIIDQNKTGFPILMNKF